MAIRKDMEKRLIVWYDKDGKILKAFPDVETAVKETGIHKNIITRNLKGWMTDAPDGTKFRYEVKAGDLRKKNIEEKNKKEQEKADRLWKKFKGE